MTPVYIPLAHGTKNPPLVSGWSSDPPPPMTIDPDHNIAKRLDHDVDIDADCREARIAAPRFLPETGRMHGRPSVGITHWWYQAEGAVYEAFTDVVKVIDAEGHESEPMLIEIRTGRSHYTVIPPSRVPVKSNGALETLRWFAEHEPRLCEFSHLRPSVVYTAITALLARHCAPDGVRWQFYEALAGFLLGTLKRSDVTRVILKTVADIVKDTDTSPGPAEWITRTEARLKNGEPCLGAPKVAELIGEHGLAVVARIRKWLGVTAEERHLELIRASEVTVEKIDWLWRSRFAKGAVTLAEGGPEKGKSTILADLAARISCGHSFPGDTETREPANVVMLIAEDDIAATVVPRLIAAGADRQRVFFLGVTRDERWDAVPFHLSDDAGRLRDKCQEVGHVAFIVVDPLVSFMGSRQGRTLNTYNDMEVRKALAPLKTLAEETHAAVAAIRHYRKGKGTDALEAGGGSVAFAALVRVIIAALPDPKDPTKYLFAIAKNNLVKKSERPALAYEIVPSATNPDIGCIAWGRVVELSANEILAAQAEADKHNTGKVKEAKVFLETFLASRGWVATKEIVAAADAHGIKKHNLERAKETLAIDVEKRKEG